MAGDGAEHRAAAGPVEEQIRSREVRKEYLCRVRGPFPDGDVVCTELSERVVRLQPNERFPNS